MRRDLALLVALLLSIVLAVSLPLDRVSGSTRSGEPAGPVVLLPMVAVAPTPTATSTPSPTPTLTPSVTPTPIPDCDPGVPEWDQRLCLRGAFVIPATVQPGESYWRLIRAVWYAENEAPFAGLHHMFVDALTKAGDRQEGVELDVSSFDGADHWTIVTESKTGELYAANFPMYVVAPAYRVVPADGKPADAVSGLGLGSIELPLYKIHTSYGFVWQLTVAEETLDEARQLNPPSPPAETWDWHAGSLERDGVAP